MWYLINCHTDGCDISLTVTLMWYLINCHTDWCGSSLTVMLIGNDWWQVEEDGQLQRATQNEQDHYEMQVRASNIVSLACAPQLRLPPSHQPMYSAAARTAFTPPPPLESPWPQLVYSAALQSPWPWLVYSAACSHPDPNLCTQLPCSHPDPD